MTEGYKQLVYESGDPLIAAPGFYLQAGSYAQSLSLPHLHCARDVVAFQEVLKICEHKAA